MHVYSCIHACLKIHTDRCSCPCKNVSEFLIPNTNQPCIHTILVSIFYQFSDLGRKQTYLTKVQQRQYSIVDQLNALRKVALAFEAPINRQNLLLALIIRALLQVSYQPLLSHITCHAYEQDTARRKYLTSRKFALSDSTCAFVPVYRVKCLSYRSQILGLLSLLTRVYVESGTFLVMTTKELY